MLSLFFCLQYATEVFVTWPAASTIDKGIAFVPLSSSICVTRPSHEKPISRMQHEPKCQMLCPMHLDDQGLHLPFSERQRPVSVIKRFLHAAKQNLKMHVSF